MTVRNLLARRWPGANLSFRERSEICTGGSYVFDDWR
jgi:hypothetical protein